MAFLSPQSTLSLSLSQVSEILYMPNIWKRENHFMALDKESDDTRFGSRLYTFLDLEITEKGIGREKTLFGIIWASPHIPDVSSMSGTIKPSVPLRPRQTCLPPSRPADALLPT